MNEYVDVEAKMCHFETWVDYTDTHILKTTFKKLLQQANFKIVSFVEHYFPVKGYTCVWVLAESHLAIHTFPSKNKSYIQISSCNEEKLKHFKALIS